MKLVKALGLAAAALFLATPAPAQEMTGKELVDRLGCLSCHSLAGRGGKKGPAWDGLGARRSTQAIRSQLTHPKSRRMPSFAFLRPGELDALVAYLSGL